MDLTKFIRDVADFPKPGIVFKDITPLLLDAKALRFSITKMANEVADLDVTKVAGIESRGFIFGTAIARELGVGFIPIRKPGKLPWRTSRIEYDLEYGSDAVEIHEDACGADDQVLIVDDLLATGGTLEASISLVEGLGANVIACSLVIELAFLKGRDRLGNKRVETLVRY
ncbi:MAG: adenine phosphoribosyltransferase [Planctomycetes bacterium]|jgi:adenine phosphoribosyltransferase|nr:adenine phosphoribosyltransferase [Planctomycetota bacterium]